MKTHNELYVLKIQYLMLLEHSSRVTPTYHISEGCDNIQVVIESSQMEGCVSIVLGQIDVVQKTTVEMLHSPARVKINHYTYSIHSVGTLLLIRQKYVQ